MNWACKIVLSLLLFGSSIAVLAQSDSQLYAGFISMLKTKDGWHSAGPDAAFYRYCENGLCQGDYLYYYESGASKHRGFYKDGRIYGKYFDYYPNRQIEDSGEIYFSRWVDTSWRYYTSGMLQRMCVHLTGGGYGSPLISYYENGQVEDYEYLDTQGYFRFRYRMEENGDTIYAEYLIDEKNWTYENYSRYDNGQLEYKGQTMYSLKPGYKNLGTWKNYNEDAELIET